MINRIKFTKFNLFNYFLNQDITAAVSEVDGEDIEVDTGAKFSSFSTFKKPKVLQHDNEIFCFCESRKL